MKPNPVVVVPGLMGSELSFQGTLVWERSFRALRLILNPAFFMPWLPLIPEKPIFAPYNELSNFFYQKGFGPDDLFWFAFDWRAGIERAAGEFAIFVNERVRRGSAVVIIAHSLGCLVTRWALCKELIPEVRVHTVIAAGPPFLGSARAFRSLIEMPEIDKTLDWYLNLARRRWPSIADQITATVTKSLMTVNSILELMPPAKVPLFVSGPTQLYDAFEWKGWPSDLQSALTNAGQTQRVIATLPWPQHIPRTLILSKKHPTEAGYFIDANDPFSINATLRTLPGDGIVVEDSARAFGFDKEIVVDKEHEFLLNDADTLRYLGTIF